MQIFFTLGLSPLTFHAQAQPLFKENSERGPNKLGIFLYRSFQLLVRWGSFSKPTVCTIKRDGLSILDCANIL